MDGICRRGESRTSSRRTWLRFRTRTASSRGSSSFQATGKQGSYAMRVVGAHALALEGVVKFHLAASKVFNILLDGASLVRLESVQDAGEPALEACAH